MMRFVEKKSLFFIGGEVNDDNQLMNDLSKC